MQVSCRHTINNCQKTSINFRWRFGALGWKLAKNSKFQPKTEIFDQIHQFSTKTPNRRRKLIEFFENCSQCARNSLTHILTKFCHPTHTQTIFRVNFHLENGNLAIYKGKNFHLKYHQNEKNSKMKNAITFCSDEICV